jgi:coenzyme Q-binding protein COQ10
MRHFEHKKFVNYTAKQMFDLVSDVESYPEFLPWCSDAKIIQKLENSRFIADLTVRFNIFMQKYRSNVVVKSEGGIYFISVESVNGVFETLKCLWVFTPNESGADIRFEVDLEFKSSLFQELVVLLFEEVSRKIISKFESRAKKIYPNFG